MGSTSTLGLDRLLGICKKLYAFNDDYEFAVNAAGIAKFKGINARFLLQRFWEEFSIARLYLLNNVNSLS